MYKLTASVLTKQEEDDVISSLNICLNGTEGAMDGIICLSSHINPGDEEIIQDIHSIEECLLNIEKRIDHVLEILTDKPS